MCMLRLKLKYSLNSQTEIKHGFNLSNCLAFQLGQSGFKSGCPFCLSYIPFLDRSRMVGIINSSVQDFYALLLEAYKRVNVGKVWSVYASQLALTDSPERT